MGMDGSVPSEKPPRLWSTTTTHTPESSCAILSGSTRSSFQPVIWLPEQEEDEEEPEDISIEDRRLTEISPDAKAKFVDGAIPQIEPKVDRTAMALPFLRRL